MKIRWTQLLGFLCAGCLAVAQPNQDPVKVLFLVGGNYHDYDESPRAMAAALQEKLRGSLRLEFVISADLELLRAQHLGKFGLLMMSLCQQTELSDALKQGLLETVRAGLPVVALHCTFWCFQSWPEFHQMLGGFVPGHARFGPMCVEMTAPDHPIAAGLPRTFELTDEPYFVNRRDPSVNVLVRTCKTYDTRDGPEPQVWTKHFSKGRIFAMTFGHDRRSQQDGNYLHLLGNGIVWAVGGSQ